jgi:phage terminase small subunit
MGQRINPKTGLNAQQERFAQEYLVDLNITQAAIRAGYSKKTAHVQGSRLLIHAKVAEYIAKNRNRLADKLEITQERVLAEYAKIAFFDPSKVFKSTESGDPYIDMSQATPDEWAAVASVQSDQYAEGKGEDGRTVKKSKITLHDKKGALDSIARHLGMFKDRLEHTGANGGPIEIAGIPGLEKMADGELDGRIAALEGRKTKKAVRK